MKVLNLEDNAIKHYEICRILKRNGIEEIDWVRNLEDGLKKVEENKYDLYIIDMWYPKHSGGPDNRSGELFIKEILKRKDPAPVILCSNQNYAYPEIYGTLYYSERSDWEEELERYIRQLKQ